jgi:hypothetical protein
MVILVTQRRGLRAAEAADRRWDYMVSRTAIFHGRRVRQSISRTFRNGSEIFQSARPDAAHHEDGEAIRCERAAS